MPDEQTTNKKPAPKFKDAPDKELSIEAKEKLTEYFNELNLYYIAELDRWVRMKYKSESQKRNRSWITSSSKTIVTLCRKHLGLRKLNTNTLVDFTIENDFYMEDITSAKVDLSLYETLNKAAIENLYWINNSGDYLKAQAKKNDEIDMLFTSLAGSKDDNKQHLYKWLTYKIFNATDSTTLPALNIFGAQGSGKNLFFERLLPTIFHGDSAIVNTSMKSVGGFNSEFEGATVLVFNESAQNKADTEGLKNIIGSRKITIEKKGVDKYQIDNLLSYLLFTNDPYGSVKLEAGGNRRYSIINADKSLNDVVRIEKGLTNETQIEDYKEKLVDTLEDEQAVMQHVKWMEENYYSDNPPKAHQSEDYEKLRDNTRNITEQTLDYVFTTALNTCIPKAIVIDTCMKMFDADTGKKANKKTIVVQIVSWMKQHGYIEKPIKLGGKTVRVIIKDGTSGSEGIYRSELLIDGFDEFNKALINLIREAS